MSEMAIIKFSTASIMGVGGSEAARNFVLAGEAMEQYGSLKEADNAKMQSIGNAMRNSGIGVGG